MNSIGQTSFPSQAHLVASARVFFHHEIVFSVLFSFVQSSPRSTANHIKQDLQGPGPCQYSSFLFLFLAMSLIPRTVLASYLADNISWIIIDGSLNNYKLPMSSPNSNSDSYHHSLELVPKNI